MKRALFVLKWAVIAVVLGVLGWYGLLYAMLDPLH